MCNKYRLLFPEKNEKEARLSLPPKRATKLTLPQAHLAQVTHTENVYVICKFCGSDKVVKYGIVEGVQYYWCNSCNRKFVANNALPRMRYPPDQIASALNMFYEGLSLNEVRRELQHRHGVLPSDSTIYEWVVRFTKVAVEKAQDVKVHIGSVWVADETVLEVDGKNIWFFDVLDDQTRYLIASHLSYSRTTGDARILMEKAFKVAGHTPEIVITDKLQAYLDGIELVFGADTEHIRSKGFVVQPNTNLIERFHGTIKERTKVMRGMHNMETAKLFMDGWLVNYNFFRPHGSLKDKTPGEMAKAHYPYRSWKDVTTEGHIPTEIRLVIKEST
ncbi:MAG: IS6 family transposase [Chloroflexi bacterium]|nr:IS6 family transposase [Chloroflexota bacterium]